MTAKQLDNIMEKLVSLIITKIYDIPYTELQEYSKLLLTTNIKINIDDGNKTKYTGICNRCGEQLNTKQSFNKHTRDDIDGSIYYKLYYLNPKECPNIGCKTIWNTESD